MLRTFFKTGLMTGRAQLAQMPDKPVGLIKLLEAVKVGGANGAVEFSAHATISDVIAAVKPFMEAMTDKPKTVSPAGQANPAPGGALK